MSDGGLPGTGRWVGVSAVGGVAGIVACALAFGANRTGFLQSYLFAYVFWVNITLGCFAMTLLHHAIKGRWAQPALRFFEAGSSLIPLMAVLFVPILLGLRDLYPWANPDIVAADPVLREKSAYLNPTFFLVRTAIYFALWTLIAYGLNRSSARQDASGDPAATDRRANLGAPGMVLFVLTVTLASTDWVMSLDPYWYSTIFGFLFVVSQALGAMAFTIVMIYAFRNVAPLADEVNPRAGRDLGNMTLTLVILWAYIAFSQYLIIYSGNLPEETTFYLERLRGSWWGMGTWLVLFQFFLPFLLLLSGRTKRAPGLLAGVGFWLLLMRALDTFWTVIPFFGGGEQPTVETYWMSAAALAGIGGVWLAAYFLRLGRYRLVPNHPPVIPKEALEHA